MRSVAVSIILASVFAGCARDPNPLVGTWSAPSRRNDWRLIPADEGAWLHVSEDGGVEYVSDSSELRSGRTISTSQHLERFGRVASPGEFVFTTESFCGFSGRPGSHPRDGASYCSTTPSELRATVTSLDGGSLVLLFTDDAGQVRTFERSEARRPPPPSLVEIEGRWVAGLTEGFELPPDGGLEPVAREESSSWMSVGSDGTLHYRRLSRFAAQATLIDLTGTLEIDGGIASTSVLNGVMQTLAPSDGGWSLTEEQESSAAGEIHLWVSPDGGTLDIWGFRRDTFSRQVR